MGSILEKLFDKYYGEDPLKLKYEIDYNLVAGEISIEDVIRFFKNYDIERSNCLFLTLFRPERFNTSEHVLDEERAEIGSYKFIPNYLGDIIHVMRQILEKEDVSSFIDVGSGTGNTLFVAKYYFNIERVMGIEINKRLVYISNLIRYYLGGEYLKLFAKNAIDFDYSGIDFISMYHPFQRVEESVMLYSQILKTMDVGSILYDYYKFNEVEIAINKLNMRVTTCRDGYFSEYYRYVKKIGKDEIEFIYF